MTRLNSSIALTCQECQARGWHYDITEHRHPITKRRSDLFGLFDVLAIRPALSPEIIGIQTGITQHALHVQRITEERADIAFEWLTAGGKIEIWTWRRLSGQRGHQLRAQRIAANDFQ